MWLLLTFQITAIALAFLNLGTYFNSYVPPFLLQLLLYGKNRNVQSKGQFINSTVPKTWLDHLYVFALGLQILILVAYIRGWEELFDIIQILIGAPVTLSGSRWIVFGLLLTQVERRLYECIVYLKPSKNATMSLHFYIAGIWHYFGMLLLLWTPARENADFKFPCNVAAVAIFAFAWFKQFESHKILGSLRKSGDDDSYKIPRGGLFKYVSCPNYLSEILVYFSFCLFFQFQHEALNWIAVRVLLNQIYVARKSHAWYKEKFGSSYPSERKRLIPFIF